MTPSTVAVGDGTVRLAARRSGTGPDFVWAHGLMCSMEVEDRSGMFDWSDVGARVIRYDARSHGRSPSDPSAEHHRWEALAGDMVDVANGHGAETAVFGGASMGAATSIWAACLTPERVAGLVLVIPPTAWSTRHSQVRMYGVAATALSTGLLTPLTIGLRLPRPRPRRGTRAALLDAVLDEVGREPNRRLAPILRGAASSDLPPPGQLREIDTPTLVLAWTGDRSHPESVARTLASTIPGAELTVDRDGPSGWPDRVAAFLEQIDVGSTARDG